MTATIAALPEIAYYYPNATWRIGSSDFIKNLLLFFDGVGVLVPEYMRDKPFVHDPELAPALRDHGMLHLLTPEEIIDRNIAEKLATSVTDVLVTGALDHLGHDGREFHELSYSRLGGYADAGLADMLCEELLNRGLARPSADGHSIPMHPLARSMVLVLLAQILRANGRSLGYDLCPTTDRQEVIDALRDLLSIRDLPTAGRVVSTDLTHVGVDLTGVPIDQILEFRRRHGDEYRKYARDVRALVRQLSHLSEEERADSFADRRTDLSDRATDLARRSASYWRRPTAFYLALLGAAAGLGGAPVAAALFAVGGAFAALGDTPPDSTGAYSYLFKARQIQV